MIFGVHLYHNNNLKSIGDFRGPGGACFVGEPSVRVTDAGLTIFKLPKDVSLKTKIHFAHDLDKQLTDRFGHGLQFATSGFSDCLEVSELKPFFEAMKKLNSGMRLIHSSYSIPGGGLHVPEGLKEIDVHIIDMHRNPKEAIVNIVKPSDGDRIEPKEGWEAYADTLRSLHREAPVQATSELNPSRATSAFGGFHP